MWSGCEIVSAFLLKEIPIAMQVVCTSAMAHRALAETSHCVSIGIHRGTRWNRHLLLRQDKHAHTDHHDSRVKVSEGDFRAKVVVVGTIGFGVDSERKSKQKARQFGP